MEPLQISSKKNPKKNSIISTANLNGFSIPTALNDSSNVHLIREILTPKILKYRECLTPDLTPNTNRMKYKIGVLEDEFTELQQFTALEKDFEATKDTDIIKNLKLQLKIAQDQLKDQSAHHWNVVHEQLEQCINP